MSMTREIYNDDDIIDSRDVIARIEELQELDRDPDYGLDEGEAEELAALLELAREGDGIEDWAYGAILIRDSYFVDYAKEYASDVEDANTARWPYTHIDWDEAAEDLQTDFTSIEFAGVTYWVR